jgi:hypothetical protein
MAHLAVLSRPVRVDDLFVRPFWNRYRCGKWRVLTVELSRLPWGDYEKETKENL